MKFFNHKTIQQLFSYGFLGWFTFTLDLLFIYLATTFLSVHYLLATTIGFLAATTLQFYLLRKFVFKKRKESLKKSYRTFIFIMTSGLIAINAFMYISVDILDQDTFVSRIGIALIIGTINFFLNRKFSFRENI